MVVASGNCISKSLFIFGVSGKRDLSASCGIHYAHILGCMYSVVDNICNDNPSKRERVMLMTGVSGSMARHGY